MKNISPQLLAFLQTHKNVQRADLILIELINGLVITATTHQMDIPFGLPKTVYSATKFGKWERGVIISEVTFQPAANDCDLTLIADSTVLFPGTTVPLMQVLMSGLLDGANVSIYTVYGPLGQPLDASLGFITNFGGQITNIQQTGRSKASLKVSDCAYLLNLQVPRNLIQASCRHTLGDANCTINLADFTDSATLSISSTVRKLYPTVPFIHASAQGLVTFTSGQNKGIPFFIQAVNEDGSLTLALPLIFPVNAGDTFNATAGCDKTVPTCTNVFDNLINIGAMPTTPVPETAV